jgi:hypothetical protein
VRELNVWNHFDSADGVMARDFQQQAEVIVGVDPFGAAQQTFVGPFRNQVEKEGK